MVFNYSTEAERGIPEPRQTHLQSFAEVNSEASPKSPPKLRRSHLRSFAEVTSEASPNSPPKLRRSQLRSFAEVNSEASPKSPPKLRRSHLRSFAEVTSKASPKSPRLWSAPLAFRIIRGEPERAPNTRDTGSGFICIYIYINIFSSVKIFGYMVHTCAL